MDYKRIVMRIEKFHLVRRILLQKSNMDFPLYPGQLHLLEFVNNHKGCTQAEVAEHLMISPASVALSTKRMEKSGLLEKRIDADNLRVRRLYVTEKGIHFSRRCRETLDEMDQVMFRDFTREELNTLIDFLDKIYSNLADGYSCNPDEMDFSSLFTIRNMIETNKRKDSNNV
jgi:DNA-binding MarR family transcriptional regulator